MEIKQIKQKLNILTVLEHYRLQPDKNQMLPCPFHQDDRPSLKIYPETGSFHCFGCGASGDQIEFIQQKEQLSKHEAILKAKRMINGSSAPIKQSPQFSNSYISTFSHSEIINKIFNYFRNGFIMRKNNKARNYLESRHLNVSKLENLGITFGYNSAQFHHRDRIDPEEMKQAEAAGLLIKSTNGSKTEYSYTPWAKHCAVFPLTDEKGTITGLYGRSTAQNTKNKHYYLKNSKGLFYRPKSDCQKLIITESIIDFLTLYQTDEIRNNYDFLPIYGTNRLTEEHSEAIKSLQNLNEIIFFFDGDKAGNEAAKKYSAELKNSVNCSLSIVNCPKGEDINSLLDGHEAEIFKHLIDTRKQFFSRKNRDFQLSTESGAPAGNTFSNERKKTSNIKKAEEPEDKPKNDSPNKQINKLNTNKPDYIIFSTTDLKLTVLGGINLQQLDRLRVTLKISAKSCSVRNNIDLYNIDQCDRFTAKAAEKLEIGTSTLNQAISELTDQLENYRLSKLESQKTHKSKERELTPEREKRAINYLKNKDLLERTNQDIGRAGIIGEETNRLLMYLVFTSRLREQPLHIISLGGSGTGKTYLQEKISELIPEHHKKEITILSENAFYYFEKTELKNKLVLIEDMDGAESVLYPLRELQSKRKISKTVPIKDPKGNLKTITLNVEGPICLAGTTTKERLYEDNANRSLLIYLDNRKAHKEQIMNYQRKLSAGKIDSRQEQEIKELFKDIQTVLKPVKVINPYAEQLKIPQHVFKPLRTNSHYLAFIETITFYKQYQRKLHTNPETGEKYIKTELEDIEEANKLIKDVLLAKSDELNKAVREFFEKVKRLIKKEKKQSFYSKEIREKLRMYPMKVNRYLRELESRNFIRRTGGNRKNGYEYEIYRTDDYNKLQSGMNILDEILRQIKESEGTQPNNKTKINHSRSTCTEHGRSITKV